MRFAFLFNGDDGSVRIDPNESEGCRWVPLEEFASLPEFRSLAPRIGKLIDLHTFNESPTNKDSAKDSNI